MGFNAPFHILGEKYKNNNRLHTYMAKFKNLIISRQTVKKVN